MALKPKVTKAELESLGDDIAQHYEPVEGKDDLYMLSVTPQGGITLEDTSGLKKALESERKAKRKAESNLERYKIDTGDDDEPQYMDPEEAARALETVAKGDGDTEERIKAAVSAERERLSRSYEREQEKLKSSLNSVSDQYKKTMLKNAGNQGVQKVKGNPRILEPIWMKDAQVVEDENGEFVIDITDENGNSRPGSGPGGRMTPEEYFSELKEDPELAIAFEGGTQTGSGSKKPDSRPSNVGGQKTISARDSAAISSNVEDIASGKVVVSDE